MGRVVWSTLAESQEITQGETCQYPGQKLCLDVELLLTQVDLRHAFPESDFGNRVFFKQSTLPRIHFTCILCLNFTLKENPFPFTCTDLLACGENIVQVLSMMLQRFRCKRLQTLMRRLQHGPIIRTQHISAPRVCHSLWGKFFLSSFMGGPILDKQLTIRSGHKFVRPS